MAKEFQLVEAMQRKEFVEEKLTISMSAISNSKDV